MPPTRSSDASARQKPPLIKANAANPPIRHNLCPHRFIKSNRRLVPIQHRPLHPPILPIRRKGDHRIQQRLPDPRPPPLRKHEHVLQPNPRTNPKGREVPEEDRIPDDPPFLLRDKAIGDRLLKHPSPQILKSARYGVGELLVLGQPQNQIPNPRQILGRGRTDRSVQLFALLPPPFRNSFASTESFPAPAIMIVTAPRNRLTV